MNLFIKFFFIYFCIINFIAFIIMGFDKIFAIRHMRRIPEKVLIFIDIILGGLGILIGCYLFRHKVRKLKLMIIFWGVFILECIVGLIVKLNI